MASGCKVAMKPYTPSAITPAPIQIHPRAYYEGYTQGVGIEVDELFASMSESRFKTPSVSVDRRRVSSTLHHTRPRQNW